MATAMLERVHGGTPVISEDEQRMEESEERGVQPSWILDPVAFGRRVRALRVIEGYDSVTALGHAVFQRTGISISDRTMYMLERGEQPPSLDVFFALLVTLKPDEGLTYFNPAIRGDVLEPLRKLLCAGK